LEWCGIKFDFGPHLGGPDAPYRQSERKAMYRQYAEELIAKGHAYYAFDTTEELEDMRKRMEASGVKSPQYNSITREHMKNSLSLPSDEVKRRLDSGAPYVIRMKIPRKEEVRFHDEIRGWVVFHSSQLDDKVLLKSDGMPTYHLANVVDDQLMKITHVIRGEEWLPSTPLHALLYESYGWEMPVMSHLPLLLKPDGNGKLSKRDGDKLGFPVFPLDWKDPFTGEMSSGYREKGYLPEAVINFLALLGWNPGDDQEVMSMDELIQKFSLDRVGKSGTKFDYQKGIWFNQIYLRKKPTLELLPSVKKRLAEEKLSTLYSDEVLAHIIELLKDRVSFVQEFVTLGIYFFKTPESYDAKMAQKQWHADSEKFVTVFAGALEKTENWKAPELESIFKQTAESLQLQNGKVMPVLRLVMTGMSFGPGVFEIMEVIGRKESIHRLHIAPKALSL